MSWSSQQLKAEPTETNSLLKRDCGNDFQHHLPFIL